MAIKGGTGKTVIAGNIAERLSRFIKVGVVDLDIDSPKMPKVLGLVDEMVINHSMKIVPTHKTNQLKLFSMGIFNKKGEQGCIHLGEQNFNTIVQALDETEWGNIDVFILDLPAGASDEMRASLEQFHNLLGCIIVMQPSTEDDLIKCFDITARLLVPLIGVIENMSGAITECGVEPICPKCGKVFNPLGTSDIEKMCKERGVDYLGRIPVLNTLPDQIKNGNCLIPKEIDEPITKASKIIRDLLGELKHGS